MRLGALLTTLLLIACGADSNDGDAGAGNGGAPSGGSSGASASGGSGGVAGGGSGGSGVGGASGTSGGSSGVGGSGGAGGSGGSGGSGGVASGGSGGSGGSSGEGGGDADAGSVECPPASSDMPAEGEACEGEGQCVFGVEPGCNAVWECFESKWTLVLDPGCFGPSGNICPGEASALEGQRCITQTCIYAPDSVCACEQPCGGIAPDPETLVMRCNAAPSAVCVQEKQAGAACAPIGTVCAPACCGAMWTCTAQGWSAGEVLCPP